MLAVVYTCQYLWSNLITLFVYAVYYTFSLTLTHVVQLTMFHTGQFLTGGPQMHACMLDAIG